MQNERFVTAVVPESDLPALEPEPTTAELLNAYVNSNDTPTHVPSMDGLRAVPVFGMSGKTVSQEDEAASRPVPPRVCSNCSERVIRREYVGEETGNPMAAREVEEIREYKYWGVWGECPRCLVPKILSGAVKVENLEAAEAVVRECSARAGAASEDDWRVIGAAYKRARFEALRAAHKDLGIDQGDDVPPAGLPTLVSIDQLARWWQVDEATVRTWVRKNSLPRPYKVGGTVRFDAMAILNWIRGGHDFDLPDAPEAAPKTSKGAGA